MRDNATKKQRTFYIASPTSSEGGVPRKCCISLPGYIWDIFDQNWRAANANSSYEISASYYFRRQLRRFLVINGVSQTEIKNEWDTFKKFCRENGKTYVSVMQKIICGAHNSVTTIMDMGVERLHKDIFGVTYSDEFNKRVLTAIDKLSDTEKESINKDYSKDSITIPSAITDSSIRRARTVVVSKDS